MRLPKCGVCAGSINLASQASQVPSPPNCQNLRARDERDRNRADSPLKPAPDAVLLDSTHMTLEETVRAAEAIVAAKLGLPDSHS